MRFLVDMPLSVQTAVFLRRLGHEATHLRDEGLQRAKDSDIVEKARQERRIVLTMDLGFGHLLAFAQTRWPSVLLLRLEDERPENIHRRLEELLPRIAEELEAGAIVVISETDLRIHRLPILPRP